MAHIFQFAFITYANREKGELFLGWWGDMGGGMKLTSLQTNPCDNKLYGM